MLEAHENNKKIISNYYSKLDMVLKLYFEEFTDDYKGNSSLFEIIVLDRMKFDSPKEWDILKEKLLEDGYFDNLQWLGPSTLYFSITDKGKLFWNDGKGGYVKEYESEQAEINRRADLEQSIINISRVIELNQKSQKKTNCTTLFFAGAAILISMFQLILSIYKEDQPKMYLIDYRKNIHSSHKILDQELNKNILGLSNDSHDTTKEKNLKY